MLPDWIVLATAMAIQTTSPYAPGLSCDSFVRDAKGCWSPSRPVQILSDDGRKVSLTPGITFCRGALLNGLALAEQLEHQCANAGNGS